MKLFLEFIKHVIALMFALALFVSPLIALILLWAYKVNTIISILVMLLVTTLWLLTLHMTNKN